MSENHPDEPQIPENEGSIASTPDASPEAATPSPEAAAEPVPAVENGPVESPATADTTPAHPAAEHPAPVPTPPAPVYGAPQPPTAPPAAAYPPPTAPGPQPHYPVGASFGPAAVPPHEPPATGTGSTPRRLGVGVVVAVAIVAAVVGGAAGGGISALTSNGNSHATPASSDGNPTTITVNDPGNATTVTAVAAKASPSVVTIDVSGSSSGGTGSGVILDTEGHILTNTHVVTLDGETDSGTIKVTLHDGRIFSGTIVGTDPISDLAVVKISGATNLQPATFADSTKLNVGDTAVAIGAPLGLSGTVTEGIISALNRSITIASSAVPDDSSDQSQGDGQTPFNFNFGQGQSNTQSQGTIALSVIQTDAAINPGNSGGALLDSEGQVIGVNVAIASTSDSSSSSSQSGSIGVGFAIPAALAQRVSSEIIASGSATHGLLGASITDSTTDSDVAGATVAKVSSGGAAEKAGIKAGDVITRFNGLPITDSTDLIADVRAQAAKATVTLTYTRGGQSYDVDVTLDTYTS